MTGAGRDATQGYLVVACAEAAAPRIPARLPLGARGNSQLAEMSPQRRPIPVRENRVIAGIAHDRWSRSLNAAMNKTTHIEIIAETSKRLRGFSLANMICSPWLEGSFIAEFRRLDGLCESAQPTSLGKT
jgi:hypothetical protein